MQRGYNTADIDGYNGFIFTNREGFVHNPQTINRAIQRIYTAYNNQEGERAKTEHREPNSIRHFSIHNLRHTFCTRFCENETNIKIIQEIMGHSDITTTMNIYAEASEEKKKESFKNLERNILGLNMVCFISTFISNKRAVTNKDKAQIEHEGFKIQGLR